jgi:DNA invertase Pin-like site-specific DNA recombinase
MKTNNLKTITHPRITPEHLRRKAVIYVRQRSLESTQEDIGRDQFVLAQQYGWPAHLIEVIDEDLAKSGSDRHRTGWLRLLDQISAGEVGAIFAADLSRLTRLVTQYGQLQRLASDHGTLLCLGNHVIDQ